MRGLKQLFRRVKLWATGSQVFHLQFQKVNRFLHFTKLFIISREARWYIFGLCHFKSGNAAFKLRERFLLGEERFPKFRYAILIFIHNLLIGYSVLPPEFQSDTQNEVLSNAKYVDAPGALSDPLNPCQTLSKSVSSDGGNTNTAPSSGHCQKSGSQFSSGEGQVP